MTLRRAVLAAGAAVLVPLGASGASAAVQDARAQAAAPTTRTVTVRYQPDPDTADPLVVDALAPSTVLTIDAVGFPADRTGTVSQCVQGADRRCRDHLPVRFDERGAARFQYLVTDAADALDVADGRCRLDAAPCSVEIRVAGVVTVVDTVFVDTLPPVGRLEATPRRDLRPGDEVQVRVDGLPADVTVTIVVCQRPDTRGARCGAPGPVVPLTTGADGAAATSITLDVVEVGADRVACGRTGPCQLVMTSDRLDVRARPVPLHFAARPGAHYSTRRVGAGLLGALALLGVAVWLRRTTEWGPPREGDGRAIDEAVLADLDAEIARQESSDPAPR